MSYLGAFRNDYYNAISVLTAAQYNTTAQTSGVLSSTLLAGAVQNYIVSSGATALTTDSAADIISTLKNAIAVAVKASLAGGSGFASGVSPPEGVPNLFNVSFLVSIQNTEGATLTLTAGTGVTITGAATVTTGTTRTYIVTVTGPSTVNFQTVGQVTTTP